MAMLQVYHHRKQREPALAESSELRKLKGAGKRLQLSLVILLVLQIEVLVKSSYVLDCNENLMSGSHALILRKLVSHVRGRRNRF